MAREEFIDKIKENLKAQKEGNERAQKIQLHNAEVVKTDGSKKWSAIKQELASIASAVNGSNEEELVYTPEDTNAVRVSSKIRPAAVRIIFDPAKASIAYSGNGLPGGFVSKINGNELVFTFDTNKYSQLTPHIPANREFTVEEMAEKMIGALVGINL